LIVVYLLDMKRKTFEIIKSWRVKTLEKKLRGHSADIIIIEGTKDERLIQTAQLMVLPRNGKVYVVDSTLEVGYNWDVRLLWEV